MAGKKRVGFLKRIGRKIARPYRRIYKAEKSGNMVEAHKIAMRVLRKNRRNTYKGIAAGIGVGALGIGGLLLRDHMTARTMAQRIRF